MRGQPPTLPVKSIKQARRICAELCRIEQWMRDTGCFSWSACARVLDTGVLIKKAVARGETERDA